MKKRGIILLTAVSMAVSLTGCGKNGTNNGKNSKYKDVKFGFTVDNEVLMDNDAVRVTCKSVEVDEEGLGHVNFILENKTDEKRKVELTDCYINGLSSLNFFMESLEPKETVETGFTIYRPEIAELGTNCVDNMGLVIVAYDVESSGLITLGDMTAERKFPKGELMGSFEGINFYAEKFEYDYSEGITVTFLFENTTDERKDVGYDTFYVDGEYDYDRHLDIVEAGMCSHVSLDLDLILPKYDKGTDKIEQLSAKFRIYQGKKKYAVSDYMSIYDPKIEGSLSDKR